MAVFNPGYSISLLKLGLGVYFYGAIIVTYMMMDINFWNKSDWKYKQWGSVGTKVIMSIMYIYFLMIFSDYRPYVFRQASAKGIVAGLVTIGGCYLMIDKVVDKITAKIFPKSYKKLMEGLKMIAENPKSAFIHVCIIAPVMEEIVLRDYFLGGMIVSHGVMTSLIASSVVFAIIHLNIVQSISAFICGLILGMIYIYTKGAVIPCIIAHAGYNMVSYYTTIMPLTKKECDNNQKL